MKPLRTLWLLVLILFLSPIANGEVIEEVTTSVDELEVLGSRGDWGEVVFRLADVLPQNRGKHWTRLVERAALGYLAILSSEGGGGAARVATQLLVTYPSLNQSRRFLAERNHLGFGEFESCFSTSPDGDECVEAMYDFVKVDASDLKFVLKSARLAADEHGGGAQVPFLELVLGKNGSAALCRRPEVSDLLVSALSLPRGEGRELASHVIGRACWPWLKGKLTKLLEGSVSPHLKEAGCGLARREVASGGKLPSGCGG